MRTKLINILKTTPMIYGLFYYIGSAAIKLLGLFIPVKKNRVLFVSFGGKKYDDSPRAIYEEMVDNPSFQNCDIYWGFVDPAQFDLPLGKKVKIDTFRYFITALSSAVWVTNSAVERGLAFKKRKTYFINTWHGTPLKKIGKDANSVQSSAGLGSKKFSAADVMLAQSSYDAQIFSNVFDIDIQNIKTYDLPRNDRLCSYTIGDVEDIKSRLNIPLDKKVILYAPTFREFNRNDDKECFLKPPINFDHWRNTIGDRYVVLFRAHYEVATVLGVTDSDFIKNVSQYPYLNDLIIASDILISDYSSIFFDYAITGKPMLCFPYDYKEYLQNRGLYLDLESCLPCGINTSEESLLKDILEMDIAKCSENTRKFKEQFAPNAGRATKEVINLIKEALKQ